MYNKMFILEIYSYLGMFYLFYFNKRIYAVVGVNPSRSSL